MIKVTGDLTEQSLEDLLMQISDYCHCPANKEGKTVHYTSCSNVNVLAPDYRPATQEEVNEALRNG